MPFEFLKKFCHKHWIFSTWYADRYLIMLFYKFISIYCFCKFWKKLLMKFLSYAFFYIIFPAAILLFFFFKPDIFKYPSCISALKTVGFNIFLFSEFPRTFGTKHSSCAIYNNFFSCWYIIYLFVYFFLRYMNRSRYHSISDWWIVTHIDKHIWLFVPCFYFTVFYIYIIHRF